MGMSWRVTALQAARSWDSTPITARQALCAAARGRVRRASHERLVRGYDTPSAQAEQVASVWFGTLYSTGDGRGQFVHATHRGGGDGHAVANGDRLLYRRIGGSVAAAGLRLH